MNDLLIDTEKRKQAKAIGRKYGMMTALIGFLMAYAIITCFLFNITQKGEIYKAFFWMFLEPEFLSPMLYGLFVMLVSGLYFGQRAGVAIIIKHKGKYGIGMRYSWLILITTAFLFGWYSYLPEMGDRKAFENNVMLPFFMISIVGTLPAIYVGAWMGSRIAKKGGAN